MDEPRHTKMYLEGVENFLRFAFSNSSGNKILCPCRRCSNSFWNEEREVREHLVCEGFLRGYKTWIFHGESSSSFLNAPDAHESEVEEESLEEDDISDLLRDLGGGLDKEGDFEDLTISEETNAYLKALHDLNNDFGQDLYPGCKKFSKLRFIIRLLHVKLLGGWSDRRFNDDDEEEEHEGHHDAVQEDEALFIQKRIPSSHNVASTHLPPRSHATTASIRQACHNQEESLVGRDVILYHLSRSDPVAKATVISTNQDTIVGGEVLGLQYYEVLVNVVLKEMWSLLVDMMECREWAMLTTYPLHGHQIRSKLAASHHCHHRVQVQMGGSSKY